MKTLLKIIFLLCFTFNGVAQNNNQNTKEQLIGIWNLNYQKSISKMDSIPKKRFVNNSDLKTRIEKNYKGRQLVFYRNTNFLQVQPDGREISGTWSLIEGESILEITSPEGQLFPFKIIKLNNINLVLKSISTNRGTPYLNEMYYDKL